MSAQKLFLVDGAKGHSGTFLLKQLLAKYNDCKIVATDLPVDTRKEIMTKETVFSKELSYMKELLEHPQVEYIPADLTKPESLKPLFEGKKYDVIFHPASLYDYGAPLELLRKINVEGLKNMLDLVIETQDLNKLRFMHWSTCGVYSTKYEYDKKAKSVILADETNSYNPPNDYNISKTEQEILLKDIMEKTDLKATIIRLGPVYGPYQIYGTYHILLILKILGRGIVMKYFPRKHRLYFPSIHIEDTTGAAIFLSEKEEAIGEAYNIVDDLVWMDEWLEWIYQQFGLNYTTLPLWWPIFKLAAKLSLKLSERRAKKAKKLGIRPLIDPPMVKYVTHQYAVSNQKLKDIGYKYKFNVWTGFKQTIDWYHEHGWLPTEENKMKIF